MDFDELVAERADELEESGVPHDAAWAQAEAEISDELAAKADYFSDLER